MDMLDMFTIDANKTRFFNGTEYRVVSILDNGLLLCVVKEEAEKGIFPLNTVIIPA